MKNGKKETQNEAIVVFRSSRQKDLFPLYERLQFLCNAPRDLKLEGQTIITHNPLLGRELQRWIGSDQKEGIQTAFLHRMARSKPILLFSSYSEMELHDQYAKLQGLCNESLDIELRIKEKCIVTYNPFLAMQLKKEIPETKNEPLPEGVLQFF